MIVFALAYRYQSELIHFSEMVTWILYWAFKKYELWRFILFKDLYGY